MSSFPSGATIVTTSDSDGRWWGFTASSFCSVSMDPPLVLTCLANTAQCFPAFAQAERWNIHVLQHKHADLAMRFATRGAPKFDGAGFVRGVERSGFPLAGKRALVVGNGGVGSAIAASLAAAGVSGLGLFDPVKESSESLADRIHEHYPQITIETGSSDPQGYDLVVNATPLGMKDGDPLPMDVDRISPDTFVGEVVMKQQITPFLQAAIDKGCQVQVGSDMLFEQIPAYLEFFGFGTTTPEELRATAQLPS